MEKYQPFFLSLNIKILQAFNIQRLISIISIFLFILGRAFQFSIPFNL